VRVRRKDGMGLRVRVEREVNFPTAYIIVYHIR
jgi:hypothetical protein